MCCIALMQNLIDCLTTPLFRPFFFLKLLKVIIFSRLRKNSLYVKTEGKKKEEKRPKGIEENRTEERELKLEIEREREREYNF